MKLYNSFTNQLETFTPRGHKHVTLYVCGITPYDTTHLGHAFTYMTFDVLQRYLKYLGYTVTYVQNVTDIDDDILKRAKQANQDWQALGQFWTDKFLTDYQALHMILPTHYVKATETITTIIEIIQVLQTKGFAYEKEGNVYFDVQKDPEYGKLSKYSRAEMISLSKERGADPTDQRKKDSLDFSMWQKSLPDEPYWHSPWGNGRPGWHIECSAMVYKYIDKYIDIHGGGSDLMYPHHESEIAQSEHFTGKKPFVNYWMHTGAVGYQGEKMSKSLGNLVMISDILKQHSANTVRFLLLSHHYRSPWEFTEEQLTKAERKTKLYIHMPTDKNDTKAGNTFLQNFDAAMLDDLQTPLALQIIENAIAAKEYHAARKMLTILGFSC